MNPKVVLQTFSIYFHPFLFFSLPIFPFTSRTKAYVTSSVAQNLEHLKLKWKILSCLQNLSENQKISLVNYVMYFLGVSEAHYEGMLKMKKKNVEMNENAMMQRKELNHSSGWKKVISLKENKKNSFKKSLEMFAVMM